MFRGAGRAWMRFAALASGVGVILMMASAGAAAQSASLGTAGKGVLYFTTYQNEGYSQYGTPNVFKRSWSYDGNGHFTLGPATPTKVTTSGTVYGWAYGNVVSTTNGADGILFGPHGNLLVAGQEANTIYNINPQTGAIVSTGSVGKNAYHMVVDPSGAAVWTFGQQGDYPGMPSKVPLPIGSGSATQYTVMLSNDSPYYCVGKNCGLTQMAFVPGPTALDPSTSLYEGKYDIFYTASPDQGGGDFGYLTPGPGNTFIAHPLATGQPWTHGLLWDPFSQSLIATGSNQIAQINPAVGFGHPGSVSVYTAGAGTNGTPEFDQVETDGAGHLFVADNHGDIYFMDYSTTGNVSTPAFVTNTFLANSLDDVVNDLPEVPLVIGLPAILIAAGLFTMRRRRRASQR